MSLKRMTTRRRLYLIAAFVLLAGLGSAAAVYLTAGSDQLNALGYEIRGGEIYSLQPDKMYIHNLEVYGGKMAVLADELSRWLARLWHGRPLAATIACITIAVSSCLVFAATRTRDS